jgi:hypothetical protein
MVKKDLDQVKFKSDYSTDRAIHKNQKLYLGYENV